MTEKGEEKVGEITMKEYLKEIKHLADTVDPVPSYDEYEVVISYVTGHPWIEQYPEKVCLYSSINGAEDPEEALIYDVWEMYDTKNDN